MIGKCSNASEFVEAAILPKGNVRVAAFDGENADPANGRRLADGLRAFTPWSELAFALAGAEGYARVRASDEARTAPGAETLQELFGGEPTLILLDELGIYLREVASLPRDREQLAPFLTALFKAVTSSPGAAIVFTLALGKDGQSSDAYADENRAVATRLAEAESVAGRQASLLNPTADDETVHVLRRRLFDRIDDAAAGPVIDAYRMLWMKHRDALPSAACEPDYIDEFRAGFPFHPELLRVLTGKTATLGNFQRVRGMLRLLARTVAQLWTDRPADALAIHLHHMDPGNEAILNEIATKLGQQAFVPAIRNDIRSTGGAGALAQALDRQHYVGIAPHASYVARTAFWHSLAFNEPLKGASAEAVRLAILGPGLDLDFIEDARKRFTLESQYLDDRAGAPMRFLVEANLNQVLRAQERNIDAGEARSQLNDRIRDIFRGQVFDLVLFPQGPWDVPDEAGDGRPKLVVLSPDSLSIGGSIDAVPDIIRRLFDRKGAEGSGLRAMRNNLAFVIADEARIVDMRERIVRRLALRELKRPERLADLAQHQRDKVAELEAKSEQDVAIAIQQCFRHVLYPSRSSRIAEDVDLAHAAITVDSASANPGAGQQGVVRLLRDLSKLRISEDAPDAPAYIRARTPLNRGQITTQALREEFRRDPVLPMLVGDDVFRRGIRQGVEAGEFVYRFADLLFGPGDPPAEIKLDEQAFVFTMAYAREKLIWPRPAPTPPASGEPGGAGSRPPGASEPPATPIVPGGGPTPTPRPGTPPGAPPPSAFEAEGALPETLARLWELARGRRAGAIAQLEVRMFEATDIFRLLGALGAIAGATKRVRIEGTYATRDGSKTQITFEGTPQDGLPIKDFLEPQLRAAKERDLVASFSLTFAEGLTLAGDEPEKLSKRLAQYASGAAQVTASAIAKA
jgi:hypothetical protein